MGTVFTTIPPSSNFMVGLLPGTAWLSDKLSQAWYVHVRCAVPMLFNDGKCLHDFFMQANISMLLIDISGPYGCCQSSAKIISMAQCETAVDPLLMQWSYCSLVLRHRYAFLWWQPTSVVSSPFSDFFICWVYVSQLYLKAYTPN